MALQHADHVCHWEENCGKDEMPDPWMWPFPDVIKEHFAQVEADREERMKGGTKERELL